MIDVNTVMEPEIGAEENFKQTQTDTEDLAEKLKSENEELKAKIDVLNEQLSEIASYNKPGLPSTKEDISELVTAYKAEEIRWEFWNIIFSDKDGIWETARGIVLCNIKYFLKHTKEFHSHTNDNGQSI